MSGQDGRLVHFPEEQLTTYLRAFNPEGRIDALLDEIAQAAIDSDVQETIELYVLAHGLMEPDERRTSEIEAVVLVEEVGLDVDDVATVLDIDRAQIEAAVADAWRAAVEDPAAPPAPDEPVATHGPADDLQITADARRPAGPWTRPGWRTLVAVLIGVLLVVLAVAVFSEAGQQRVAAQGLNPVIAFGSLVALLVVGGLLVMLGEEDEG